MAEAAVVTPEPKNGEFGIPESIMGAVQMLEELALQFDIILPEAELSKYKLIILPEDLTADADLRKRLDAYLENGGAVIACARGGSDKEGRYPSRFGAKILGENEAFPDFIVAEGFMGEGLEPGNEYVIYRQGLRIEPETAETILSARAPYFPRKGSRFCSHRYTPSAKGETYPAAVQNGKAILFAHPLFQQYRHNAPFWCKKLIDNAISRLIPNRFVRHDGPSTLSVNLLRQPEHNRVCVHLLSYVPVRKSATIDIIEERTTLRDVRLTFNLPAPIVSARLAPEGTPLPVEGNTVTVPVIDGYAVLEIGL
jgi:hypothetical protein